MKILITGATGFIGGALARKLHRCGLTVTGTGRNPQKLRELQQDGLMVKRGDLKDPEFAAAVCGNQQAVIHCAAKVADCGPLRQFLPDTVHATQTICHAAVQANVQRFILLSTPSILFGPYGGENRQESDVLPMRNLSPYAKAKVLAETIVRETSPYFQSTCILRPQAVFGPGEAHLFPRLLRANRHLGIPLYRNGTHAIDITSIDTVIHAVEQILMLNRSALTVANISNDDPWRFKTLIQHLFSACGENPRFFNAHPTPLLAAAHVAETIGRFRSKPPSITPSALPMILYPRTLDVCFARDILKIRPPVSISETIQNFAHRWKQTELLFKTQNA